ncbi:MAG: cytochrome b/b6 domain-containing protein [Pseudomonadota bacterium]
MEKSVPVAAPAADDAVPAGTVIARHALVTRIWHWLNAVSIFIMIGSGLMIFNAHPRLYWGSYGANYDTPWLTLSRFPGWLTLPSHYSLSMGRRWHLFFALVLAFGLLVFMVASLVNRHFQRDLRVRTSELAPRHLWADLKDHLAFRFHDPKNPRAYNIFQKLSYVSVLFGLIPVLILSGLTLSPGMDAAWPVLLDLFGGRQSARSVHFIAMVLLCAFIVVHLALVILAGPFNEVRSMITGRWRVPEESE